MAKLQMNVKLEKRDLLLVQKIASDRGQNTSDFVRFVIRKEFGRLGFLSKKQMQSLGVDI